MFKVRDKSLRGLIAAWLCMDAGFFIATYVNDIMQYPNQLPVYIGFALCFAAPHIDKRIREEKELSIPNKETDKQERLATVLYNLIEAIRFAAIALEPFMPSTSTKILDQIHTDLRDFKDLSTFGLYPVGNKVTDKPQQLFARLDPKEVEKKVEALQPKKQEQKEDENQITIDDFAKIELTVGTVEKCEKHPDADKLLISQINIGKEVRQIVSGIADFYSPEDMIGKKVIVVSNLKPAVLRGVESQGMILAGSKKKLLELVSVESLPNGTKIK